MVHGWGKELEEWAGRRGQTRWRSQCMEERMDKKQEKGVRRACLSIFECFEVSHPLRKIVP